MRHLRRADSAALPLGCPWGSPRRGALRGTVRKPFKGNPFGKIETAICFFFGQRGWMLLLLVYYIYIYTYIHIYIHIYIHGYILFFF